MRDEATIVLAGRRVPRVGLGLARPFLGDTSDDRSVEQLIDHALDTGLRYLDTARAYTTPDHASRSEAVLAHALRRRRPVDGLVIGTKGGHFRDGREWPVDARPAALRRDCESSLRWLGRERIDLYFLHYPDPAVPLEDSVGALHDLRSAGLIHTIGLCNVTVGQLERASRVTEIGAVQNRYSPYDTSSEEVIEHCSRRGIPFIAYSPLGGARRTRPIQEVSTTATGIADARSIDVESVLLAWVLGRSHGMLALTGSSRPATLDSSAAALAVDLDDDDRARITADVAGSAA